jgi:non-ribosomal peptide synthetase component F
VPSVLELLIEEADVARCTRLQHVFVGGEALSNALRERFFERLPHARLYNFYGPSETTIDATWFACAPGPSERSVPIGRPLGYTEAYVMDDRLQPCPIGVPGELFLGGPGLARGYLGAPELTAEGFVPHPFSRQPGARLYRTGDRVQWRSDGNIEFLGRLDEQVKIRGVRVELREVETILRQHPAIREAVVVTTSRTAIGREDRLLRTLTEIEEMSENDASALLTSQE